MALSASRRSIALTVAGVLMGILATISSRAAEISYEGSLQYSTGEYFFEEQVNSLYFFNGLDIDSGRLNLNARIPIIIQDSPWITFTGSGLLPSGGSTRSYASTRGRFPAGDTTGAVDMGLGDLYVTGGLDLVEWEGARPGVMLSVSVKAPLADELEGFGTGEWDFGAGLSISTLVKGLFLGGEVGYWTFGDMPDVEFDDVVTFGFSIGRSFSGAKYGIMASFYGYTATFEDIEGPLQVALGFNYLTDSGSGLMASVAAGLTESAPDISISAGWSVPLRK